MSVYKMSEIVGTSKESYAEATRVAIKKASKTVRNLEWFEVVEMRGVVADGDVAEFQVKLKLGFKLD